MGRLVRIALATPLFYILLPEVGIAWVDRIGPAQAVELMFWLSTASVALALLMMGGIVCLLVKKLRCLLAYLPARA